MLVSASYDDTLKLWSADDEPGGAVGEDWSCRQTLSGHTSTVWDVAFERSGARMASCSDDKTVALWDCRGEAGTWKRVDVIAGCVDLATQGSASLSNSRWSFDA